MTTDEETTIHLYHLAIDFLGKASCYPKTIIDNVRERLKAEAARTQGDDSIALRCIANSLEPYLQD